jgi:hypothetical protein
MRDYLEERERTLERCVDELEEALHQIIAWGRPKQPYDGFRVIAHKALGLTDANS